MIEPIQTSAELTPFGARFYVEYLPERTHIQAIELIAGSPDIADIKGNADEGYYADLHFANGHAVYDLKPSGIPDVWDATLRSWEAKDA